MLIFDESTHKVISLNLQQTPIIELVFFAERSLTVKMKQMKTKCTYFSKKKIVKINYEEIKNDFSMTDFLQEK